MFVDVVILCTLKKKKKNRSLSYFKLKLLIMFFILKLYTLNMYVIYLSIHVCK